MRSGVARIALRVLAIAIVVAALIDPVMTVARFAPEPVVVARLASLEVAAAEAALRAGLPNAEVTVRSAGGRRLPCALSEACVIVADGSVDVDLPADLGAPVSLIQIRAAAGLNVEVRSVTAAISQHAAASGTVLVSISGTGVQGRRTELRVSDGTATVGSAVHEWTADGDAAIEIPWWPLADGPRALRVTAVPLDGEVSALDNAVELGVMVSSDRARVLVFDARPSWASTFVRRALEDDARFQVEHRVGLGRRLVAGTAGGRLDPRTLEAAAVVIVGGPDGLSASDVALLERFVRERGGTLVLLPDRPPAGAAARLFAGRWTEHLEASASPIGLLRASETIRLVEASPVDVVLGSVKGRPVLVLSPSGNGKVVVSGAMDAWRYRDADGGAFDRFWRSVVFESAADSAAIRLDVTHPIAVPGATVPFEVRVRRMDAAASSVVAATVSCGDRPAQTIRMWPQGPAGVFAGKVPIEGAEPCEVSVAVDGGPGVTGAIAVTNGATQSVRAVLAKLEHYALSTGGVVAPAGGEHEVATALTSAGSRPVLPETVHPMRSPWWMWPFATCLSAEWWLRRRVGLR